MFDYNYKAVKVNSIKGRLVTNQDIDPYLESVSPIFPVSIRGKSVEGRTIKSLSLGSGNTRILMWSQMHGNESTTTKAVLDLVNFLKEGSDLAAEILEACTIKVIPILNPDGALAYTRVNANLVDLNRDAQERTQPESVVLREVYDDFKPDYCFNLHDQRTIFNVGNTAKPATVSFLAPANDPERSISDNRGIAMKLIVAMNNALQKLIPGQVGRYDDGFNSNCVGDAFQMLNTPTLLFEAGHYPNDYDREQTRYYIFIALMEAIGVITKNKIEANTLTPYFEIPENNKLFYDVIIQNIDQVNSTYQTGDCAGILFVETLVGNKIEFAANLEIIGDLSQFYGHKTYNCLDIKDLETIRNTANLLNLLK
ncbi:Murein peptide amidase A [Arenibacter antarcticus]|uniref:M14 metallopeptidase family protein n=1 Tax=Arenibacter antarcticus TaxID=2040469 RepID=A0ABW5VGB6_9FLAO|nr:M14 metallopeptidase family protein [Arenibacter sp. H213]MCM4166221.1 peptidase M14 [Arenibacter sp. H213]